MISMLLILAAQTAPMTQREALTLPPAQVGERLLDGQDHRPIVSVEAEPRRGLMTPEVDMVWLYERPEAIKGGCVRRRWTARFRYGAGMSQEAAAFEGASAVEEVGAAVGGACARATFAGYAPAVSRPRALVLLAAFERWRARPGRTRLRCFTDRPSSTLCASAARTRAELTRMVPWFVRTDLSLWATLDGAPGIDIGFDAVPPGEVTVRQTVPAPF